ncbi:hypothetical protein [Thalassovita taeanensis]|uniref:Cytochrome c domain-containing protein n=1 Tax=Thalassovita taeanensis TaxID=657014 RepID=A0A1H9L4Y9_9RHOB|nr:hypothetical protein [Thalassovita taeanensis]SER06207.1 hypothetical protein SAMN04488092_1238 [Thalassovita taeanensis]
MNLTAFPAALLALIGTVALAAASDISVMTTQQIMTARPTSGELAVAGRIYNPEAPVPPQCYTAIEGRYNPCYVCHQNNDDPTRPSFMQDGSLQQAYEFSEAGLTNHHRNLFLDRTDQVAAISDRDILAYIDHDNYSPLADRLNANGWTGWKPDLAGYADGTTAFDARGHARDGSGWVAFNYKPQPSTFWPTNGSTDDVLIRLPAAFRTLPDGSPSRDAYTANLALLELSFQDLDSVTLPAVDETALNDDIDGDGKLGTATTITRRATYLGAASEVPLHRMLYPLGTEFLHSVRYVGIDGDKITTARRMKELRYMIKTRALSLPELASRYGNEIQEKIDENLPRYIDLGDRGMDTGFGWTLLGFIEDADGALRPQTNEEQFFCRGCHSTLGANLDQTWAFPRKQRGAQGWGYIDYTTMRDLPNLGEAMGEIETYFTRVGGGDEFRSNTEILARWFNPDGTVNHAAMAGKTVYDLITPSRERALQLNKAYRVIVSQQSFVYGRDATVTPPHNVHERIDDATADTLPRDKRFAHDIRLSWD